MFIGFDRFQPALKHSSAPIEQQVVGADGHLRRLDGFVSKPELSNSNVSDGAACRTT
jgi:hypothetical protein